MEQGGRQHTAGLILAGGASARMGRAKALVEHEGRTFLAAGVELLRAGGCASVLVVDGAHRLSAELPGLAEVELVHNEAWALGPLSSLQVGLRRALELEPSLAGLLVHPIERPRVRAETIARLLAAFANDPDGLWQPVMSDRSGHPMLWPRQLFEPLLSLDPTHDTARTLVRGAASGLRRRLEVDDPGIFDNLDTPADLATLRDARTSTDR